MAYIVGLVCVMRAIFLLASGGRMTLETVALARRAHKRPRRIVHQRIWAPEGVIL